MALTENEIRPDDLMKEQQIRYARDVAWLNQQIADFVMVDCPACASKNSSTEFEKYGLKYSRCHNCLTIFINPRPTPKILEEFYTRSENYKFWNDHIFPASENARREKIFRPRARRLIDIIERFDSDKGLLIEVGAGFGTFCEEMRDLKVFKDIIAIEPTPDLANTCRKRGLKVIEKPIENCELDQLKADVVASFEVLEHLYDPSIFLASASKLLNSKGILILSCPNGLGFEINTLRKEAQSIDTEHLNYFNPQSIQILIERAGLEIIEITTPGELDAELVRKRILAHDLDVSNNPFLKQVLIDQWEKLGKNFQHFLQANNLSSHMWISARKP